MARRPPRRANPAIEHPDAGPLARAAYSLAVSTLVLLRTKGVLTEAEIIEMLDLHQLGLEGMGLRGQYVQAVHSILEETRAFLTGRKSPP